MRNEIEGLCPTLNLVFIVWSHIFQLLAFPHLHLALQNVANVTDITDGHFLR